MLKRIQDLVRRGQYRIPASVLSEMDELEIYVKDVMDTILKAECISNSYPSVHPAFHGEMLYEIIGEAVNERWIYTKGRISDN